jgi:glutaredoxin-related protein
MIVVYGADWCEDTRRSLRHLRRLGVAHEYVNIDEDLDALARAKSLNDGQRRTPVIDLGLGGPALVEPDNDSLTAAIVERDMLSVDTVAERLAVQNVGDFERVLRTIAGGVLLVSSRLGPSTARMPLAMLGTLIGLTGIIGWCPLYHANGMTSMLGPGDRPDEATRDSWLAPRASHHVREASPAASRSGTPAAGHVRIAPR